MELVYQYLWKHRMFGLNFTLNDGRRVEVIDPGRLNTDAGPDFFNAKIRIDGSVWAGNVEIHVRASDWWRHNHHTDPAYDSVILHVVAISDRQVTRTDGTPVPQAEVTLPENFYMAYATLRRDIKAVKCAAALGTIPQLLIADWVSTLAVERLQHKAERIISTYHACNGDWHQTLFITLARALGFGLNGEPFEMLARATPLHFMRRHADQPLQLQAILFGQAGMLRPDAYPFDTYYQSLCREYNFLSRKYNLRPIPSGSWKFARTRPQNLPYRRIAMLASFVADPECNLASKMLDARGREDELRLIFGRSLEGYWTGHYAFGTPEVPAPATLSAASIAILLINVAAPFYYAYAALRSEPEVAEHAFTVLQTLAPEQNSIISAWRQSGIRCRDASESQALIHLRREYCDCNRCLDCRFGHHLLRARLVPPRTGEPLSPYAVPEE